MLTDLKRDGILCGVEPLSSDRRRPTVSKVANFHDHRGLQKVPAPGEMLLGENLSFNYNKKTKQKKEGSSPPVEEEA